MRRALIPCSPRWLAALALLLCAGLLQAASPSLSIITPRGIQRGTEAEVLFHGARLNDAQEILFYEPGISAASMDGTNPAQLKVKLKLEPTARLGTHIVRVRTAGGISEAAALSVGQYPVVDEKEPNNDFAAPQKVALNTSIHGVAGNEDIDYFLIEAKKGQRITAEVEAMRLGSALVDCYVAILDMKRFELAVCDDSALALQDPVASIVAPADGTYVVAVRESSYAGNDGSRYCLHLGEAPRPLMAYPAGGKAGEEIDVKLLGDVRGTITQKIKLPEKLGDFDYYFTQDGQSAPSPNKFRVRPFGNALETEPNNTAAEATKTDAELPLAFNGIIEKAGDVDFFRFKAKAGQTYDVRCVARGARSPLDPVLTIHNADGAQIAENDDAGGPDSQVRWAVPAAGEFLVAVRDHLRKGGPEYVYRVEFNPVAPSLTLNIPEYARNSQERNTVSVPRGNRYATQIRVGRADFAGDVSVAMPELPPGVTMSCDTLAGNVNEIVAVFEAAADAPLGAKLVPVTGENLPAKTLKGGFAQTLDLVYGPPNATVYYRASVDRMAVAVTEEVPFKIQIIEPKVPLVQSGSMNLKVVATRKEGFKAPITLRMLWNPPGIGSQNEVVIPEGQTEGLYPVNANGDAPTRAWKIAITATSDAGKGTVWTSSQLATLNIASPFLTMQIPMAAGEQAKAAGVLCKIQQLQPFTGEAQVQLHGLPPKVTIEKNPLTITKDSQDVTFNAALAADAPVGQHKSLFCQVTVMKDGEPIVHKLGGGGVLRIDEPPPPKPNTPAPAAAPVAAAAAAPPPPAPAAPAKALTRLEKLRLEASEARAGKK